jgi:D-alanyl-D-alanine carboxypeptidase (penicillin-binding protein 5/6)
MARIEGHCEVLDRRDNAGVAEPGDAEIEVNMKEQFNVQRSKSLVDGRKILYSFVFLLLTFWFSVLTASAAEIKSRAAVVMDAVTGRVLYAKNPDLMLLPASTTKLMTALVVVERANLSSVTTVSAKAAATAPTKAGLKAGDKVTLENLLYAALMKSANDAAVALAEGVAGSEEAFVTLMNRKAISIGADDTHFVNANGLPAKGQHITAYDLSKIMREAIKYPILKEILGTRITEVSTETGKTMFIKNTNRLLWSDEELLGGKTGYTRKARHCFVCAGERENETIIVALLGAPSRDLLWKESEELMNFGIKVVNKTEEPVIYLTKDDRDALKATKALYTEEDAPVVKKPIRKRGKRGVIHARRVAKKSGRLAARKQRRNIAASHEKKEAMKNKEALRAAAKSEQLKRANIAKQKEDGDEG